jgi:hypothetical protein
MKSDDFFDPEPIHGWFNLTYASYLVLPRSVLQSAPVDLQLRLVACLEELDEIFGDVLGGRYRVQKLGERGRFVRDELADYDRGRRRISTDAERAAAG